MITEYGKMLLTLDAEISAMIGGVLIAARQTTSNPTIQATEPWWFPVGMLAMFLLVSWLALDTVKALIKNARLYLIISSYPLFLVSCNFVFTFIYIYWNVPSLVGGLSKITSPEQITAIITPMYRNMIIGQRVFMDLVCIFLAPIYAYYVAKELKIYKRLGIDSSNPTKPRKLKKLSSNDTVIEMLRSTIIKGADDREY